MIYLKSLRLKNFMIFNDYYIEFNIPQTKNTFTIISGDNGSGKSCISSESIYFLIFGRGLRSNKNEDLINIHSMEAEVFGEFIINIGDKNFIFGIERKINRSSQSSVRVKVISDVDTDFNIVNEIKNLTSITKNNVINNKIQQIFNITTKDFVKIHLHSPYSITPIPHDQNIIGDNILFNIFKEIEEINFIYVRCKKVLDSINLNLSRYRDQLEYLDNLMMIKDNSNINEDEIMLTIDKINEAENALKETLVKLKTDLELENKNLIFIDSNIASINSKNAELNKKSHRVKNLSICPTCNRNITKSEIENILLSINHEIDKHLENLRDLEKIKKKHLDTINIINNNINKVNDKLLKIYKDKSSLLNKLDSLKYIKNYDSIKNELVSKIKELSSEYQIVEELNTIFNKKSPWVFRSVYNNIKSLSNMFKSIYSAIINPEDIITFDLTDNKISIYLNDIPYTLLSTSQKKRMELVYILTIIAYSIIKIKNKNGLGLIILDEFFDSFDPNMIFKILYNLINIKSKNSNQFIITSNYFNSENIEAFYNIENVKIINISSSNS